MTPGEAIKVLRAYSGFSQTELAKKLKISRPYLSGIENNKCNPSLFILADAAEIFDVPVTLFIALGDKKLSKEIRIQITKTLTDKFNLT